MAFNSLDFTNTPLRLAGDVAAVGGGLGLSAAGVITGWAGAVAAVLTVLWFGYQIYDLYDRRKRRRAIAKKRKR